MFNQLKQKLKKKNIECSQKLNGVEDLNDDLKKKWLSFNNASQGEKYSKYFTWYEFCTIVVKTTYEYNFIYKNTEYSIMNEKKYFSFVSEEKSAYYKYKSFDELLSNLKIENKILKEVYNDIKII